MEARLINRGLSSGRSDDNAETIRKRFRTFVEESMPVIDELEQRGVAGVCIEDKLFPKTNSFIDGERQPLADVQEFCGKIKAGKDSQHDEDFCIIARVEALIAGWDLDEALALAEAAVQLDPQPSMLDTLGYVQLQRGEPQQAADSFERSLAANPDVPVVMYRLGVALARSGDVDGARSVLQRALSGGAFPEAGAAQRELARLTQN